MRKHIKVLCLLAFMFIFTISFPLPVSASHSLGVVNYRATSNLALQWSVGNPGYAHDWNNGTCADWMYGSTSTGSFQVSDFTAVGTAPPANRLIAFVDFKMNYYAEGGSDDEYRIVYYVDPSGVETVLVDWSQATHAAATDVWYDQDDPNDLTWSWTDIANIRFLVKGNWGVDGKTNRRDFEEYEAWVTVYYYRQPTITVDAPDTTQSAPFTVKVNITNADSLYAYEFRLLYDKTKLTATRMRGNTTGTFFYGYDTPKVMKNDTNDAAGRVWGGVTLLGDVQGVSGNGTLAIIDFSIDAAGTSNLTLSQTKLIGYDYTNKRIFRMTHTTVDDAVTVTTGVPEFPFGAALEMGLIAVIIYVWWTKKRKMPTRTHMTSR